MSNWQPHESVGRTEYVVSLERELEKSKAALIDAALIHANLVQERDAARAELERSTDWYQQRFNRLRRWVEEEVRPLSSEAATHYYAICANGSAVSHESADWQNTMHSAKLRFELAERARDEARVRSRRACQILIEEVGADGPADVDSVAERAAAEIRDLRNRVTDLRALQEESEHEMHLRIRSGYDKTIADCWRAKVKEVEDQCNANAREIDRLRHERRNLRARLEECRPWVGVCPLEPAKIKEVCLVRDLADDTLKEVKK